VNDLNTTVHVIDDDASTRRALARLISTLGFRVSVFASAEAFLAQVTSEPDGCLLVDIHMPNGMNGVELCTKLEERGWKRPTILMTGHSDPVTRRLAAKIKPVATLLKPFDEEALLYAINLAISPNL
jgi:FixJ family two-component response regulator